MNVPDVYDLWEAHEAEQEKALAERLVCDYCRHPIQDDHHYEINGDILCEGCMNDHFRKEDY